MLFRQKSQCPAIYCNVLGGSQEHKQEVQGCYGRNIGLLQLLLCPICAEHQQQGACALQRDLQHRLCLRKRHIKQPVIKNALTPREEYCSDLCLRKRHVKQPVIKNAFTPREEYCSDLCHFFSGLLQLQYAFFPDSKSVQGNIKWEVTVCKVSCEDFERFRMSHNPRFPPSKSQTVHAVNNGTPKKLERVGVAGDGKDANLCV